MDFDFAGIQSHNQGQEGCRECGVENVGDFIGLPCLGTLNNLCCSHGRCQKLDALSSRNMMPLNPIFIIEVFDF